METLPVTLGDNYRTTLVSTLCVAFYIFIVGERRDFIFGTRVDHSESKPSDHKLSLKGEWSCHVMWPIFNC